jgi:predicted nucleic acid binding AN1-type Zn finger protein
MSTLDPIPMISSLQMDISKRAINLHRCVSCRKKLGLVVFTCKCGNNYCSSHRLSSDHDCSYNYQDEFKKTLDKQLVKVVGVKVDKL